MINETTIAEVRKVFQKFQDGYEARDPSALDEFMQLFVKSNDIELIGIGAATRGGNEWFQGPDKVREIIDSDWRFWGDVKLEVSNAQITVVEETAWLSTSGELVQNAALDDSMGYYIKQMKELLDNNDADPDTRMMEATHFGLRRLRERQKGLGYRWPLVITAVLVREDMTWRFHTLHWSMPVD